MLITNSKRKDYYDGVAGTTGIDKKIVYDRHIVEFNRNDIPAFFKRKFGYRKFKDTTPFIKLDSYRLNGYGHSLYDGYNFFIIGFCGKFYAGWKLYKEIKKDYNTELITSITYSFDFIKSIVDEKTWGGIYLEDNYNHIINYDAIDLFREYNSPIFIYDNDFNRNYIDYYNRVNPKFIINANLSDYEFYKLFDSFQAFQEISMFIGGVLGNKEKDIIEISDKNKIESHGFDKWSFRKMKEDK